MSRFPRLPLVALLLAAPALAKPQEGWHRKLDDAVDAAKKSGKPVLVVTLWQDGV